MSDTANLCMKCMRHSLGEDGVCTKCKADEKTMWEALHHLRPRTLLMNRYLVGKAIGEGGFGITYVGRDTTLSVKVAIKEYYPSGFASRDSSGSTTVHSFSGEKGEFFAEGRDRFIEEAQRLARFFGMPGIVSVKDFFNENGTAYIVMEFVEGSTMRVILDSMGNKLPEPHVMEMMKPLVISLAQMHKQGVIHRDIAPDNIMVQPNGSVKLLDFGTARDMATDMKSTVAVMKHGYAPEEQYDSNRNRQGPWTDVYALCATIFRAIEGETPPDAIARLRKDEFKGFKQPVSENTRSVIIKGLSLAPGERWQNIEQLAEALYPNTVVEHRRSTSVASEAEVVSPKVPTSVAPEAEAVPPKVPIVFNDILRKLQQKPVMIAAAVVAVLVVFIGGVSLLTQDTAEDVVPMTAQIASPPVLVPDTPPVQDEEEEDEEDEPPQNNAEYGRMVAKEFLSKFTAMFLEYDEALTYMANLFGVELESSWDIGQHMMNLGVRENPELIPDGVVNDWSFSDDLWSRAGQPVFWDIDGSGIPVIGIAYYAMFANGRAPFEIFRYVDGSYSHIGSVVFNIYSDNRTFYRDSNGRLLAFATSGWEPPAVTFINMTNYGIYMEAMQPHPWHELVSDLYELSWDWDRDTYLVPGLPLADLTPIPPMEDLAEEIRESLEPLARERFEASFDVLADLIANSPVDDSDDNANLDFPEWRTIFIERLRDVQEQMDEQYGSFDLYNDENIAVLAIDNGFGVNITSYIHGVGLNEVRGHGLSDSATSSVWIRPEQSALYLISRGREHMETFYVLEGNNFVYRFGMRYDELDISFSDGSVSEFLRRRAYVEAAALVSPQSFRTPGEAIAALENLNISLRGEPSELETFRFANYFIIPDSNSRELTPEEIRHLSTEDLRIARNEIYARHGRPFTRPEVRAHFDSMPWYQMWPLEPGETIPQSRDRFDARWPHIRNDFERENIDTIVNEERRRNQ